MFIVQYNADLLIYNDEYIDSHFASVLKLSYIADAIIGNGGVYIKDAIQESYVVERCDYPVDDDDETFQKELEFFGRFIAQYV